MALRPASINCISDMQSYSYADEFMTHRGFSGVAYDRWPVRCFKSRKLVTMGTAYPRSKNSERPGQVRKKHTVVSRRNKITKVTYL
jgi:hypothetical protein